MLPFFQDKTIRTRRWAWAQLVAKRQQCLLWSCVLVLTGCNAPPEPPIAVESPTAPIDVLGIARGDTSEARIAFSVSFVKEASFRKAIVRSFRAAATTAKDRGLIADFTILDANQEIQTQIEQVQQLTAENYDAIVLLSGSATELNPAVKAACDAGVVVVDFDGEVTEPCAHTVSVIWEQLGFVQGNYLGSRLEAGNLLELRGVPGSTSDTDISAGIHAALAEFPQLKVVESVRGDWTQSIARTNVAQVLPTLPEIAGVVTQGGDGHGTALAFAASDRPLPIIVMGNRHEELQWWQEQRDVSGYETISVSIPPGIAAVSFWVAQQILAGKEAVPQSIGMPVLVIDADNLDRWLARTPEGSMADANYTLEWTAELIDAQINDEPLPEPPLPDVE